MGRWHGRGSSKGSELRDVSLGKLCTCCLWWATGCHWPDVMKVPELTLRLCLAVSLYVTDCLALTLLSETGDREIREMFYLRNPPCVKLGKPCTWC
jgi:hypothetical protein